MNCHLYVLCTHLPYLIHAANANKLINSSVWRRRCPRPAHGAATLGRQGAADGSARPWPLAAAVGPARRRAGAARRATSPSRRVCGHGRLAEHRHPRRRHRGLPRPAGKGGAAQSGAPDTHPGGGPWAWGRAGAARGLPGRPRRSPRSAPGTRSGSGAAGAPPRLLER